VKAFGAFASRITRAYVALACALIVLVVLTSTLLAFLLYTGTLNEAVTETAQRAADMAAQGSAAHESTAQIASAVVARLNQGRVHIVAFDESRHLLAGHPEGPSFFSLFGARPQIVRIAGGIIVVAPDFSRFLVVLGWYWSIVLPVGAIAVLIAWFAGRRLTRRALDPLENVTQALRRIAAGDFQPELLSNGSTELRALTSAYNDVAHRLTAATAQRRQDEARMRQFIADAGHELRTPLTVIMGYLDMLRQGAIRDTETAARINETMRDESQRMRSVIEKLILLARLDRPPSQRGRSIDAAAIARRVVAELAPIAGDRITLNAGDGVMVHGDESELYEAIKNVVDNALKYAPDSPVRVDVASDGAGATIAVTDSGAGIEPADLPHVFERFYRGSARQGAEGSGLGLAIAKSAIERAGGTIAVESVRGEGTRVFIHLPEHVTQ
jgi:signal transduction histidine kinase